MTMWNSKILHLLSHHRQPGQPALPAALSMTQITSLLRQCLDPDQPTDQIADEVQESLRELEAQNEIFRASGNRYCMAPPTLFALNRDNWTGCRFRGDRAYLSLAHETLKTRQQPTEEKLHSGIKNFTLAKSRLQDKKIRLLTLEEVINELPKPQKPPYFLLQGHQYPLTCSELSQMSDVKQYVPAYAEQKDRWRSLTPQTLSNESLLRLPDETYLWFEAEEFYEIELDTAILAMFYLDRCAQQPLRVVWANAAMNQLNLQNIWLPYAHFQWLRQLSEPTEGHRRVFFVSPANRPLVEAVFQYLGCDIR